MKPKCWIFDIDGTLSDRNGRNPFDCTKVLEDLPNKNIVFLYKQLRDVDHAEWGNENQSFIIVTGRPELCRKDTEEWLKVNMIYYDKLYMRPLDNLKGLDTDVKIKIYKENIEPYYDVVAVFEDRSRVVKMWRDHFTLTCLQVSEGNF